MDKRTKFMLTEKWLFRIYLLWIVVAVTLLTLATQFGHEIKAFLDAMSQVFVLLLFLPIVLFVTAIIRIILFVVRFKGDPEKPTIWRSIVTLLTSPVMEVFYFIFLFVSLLSLSSCTYSG